MDIDEDDFFPGDAKDMGSGKILIHEMSSIICVFSEAKIRFLKARLRVMQEELERMHTECVKRVSRNYSIARQSIFHSGRTK